MDDWPEPKITVEGWMLPDGTQEMKAKNSLEVNFKIGWGKVAVPVPPDEEWHHAVCHWDESTDPKIAIDGVWWPSEWPKFLQGLVYRWRRWRNI